MASPYPVSTATVNPLLLSETQRQGEVVVSPVYMVKFLIDKDISDCICAVGQSNSTVMQVNTLFQRPQMSHQQIKSYVDQSRKGKYVKQDHR